MICGFVMGEYERAVMNPVTATRTFANGWPASSRRIPPMDAPRSSLTV